MRRVGSPTTGSRRRCRARAQIISILKEHGDYRWLTGRGSVTILNNGIEFAAIYFVMLLSLFFTGGGRYTSIDYWLARAAKRSV